MHTSTGILSYDPQIYDLGFRKLIVRIDPEITRFYRSLVPKYIRLNPQRYEPHISVVRKEAPPRIENWGKRDGQEITFQYDPTIQSGDIYFWLNIFCVELEEIRTELGLEISSPYTKPPDGFLKCFHSTIGNTKRL